MVDNTQFDIVVIGSGPGGYVTAIRAAQLGMKTALVEKEHLGGICLNWGCIPTKALLRSTEILNYMKNANSYGLKAEKIGFDLSKIVERSRIVSTQLSKGVGFLLKKNKVSIIDGEAKLNGPGKIDVSKDGNLMSSLTAKHIIIATGARPRSLPELETDGNLVWSYFEALAPEKIPKSLLIVGSGAIGIEFASFYQSIGAEVTVVEVMPQVLPMEDPEIAKFARTQFEKHGIKIMSGAKVCKLDKAKNSVTATIETTDGKTETLTIDRVISAVGVVGNIENIGLDSTKIKTERGCIIADEFSRTAEPDIYAIGDVAGPPMLAHKAEHEGIICVENIMGLPNVHPMDKSKIPGCTYCNPQIASVGLTETKAKESGYKVKIGRFPFIGNGKAIALGESEGMVKTVFDEKTGELLGAHMVGAEVTELIQGFVVAMGLEATEAELMNTVFPHPTLSEMMHESILDAYDRAIHI